MLTKKGKFKRTIHYVFMDLGLSTFITETKSLKRTFERLRLFHEGDNTPLPIPTKKKKTNDSCLLADNLYEYLRNQIRIVVPV